MVRWLGDTLSWARRYEGKEKCGVGTERKHTSAWSILIIASIGSVFWYFDLDVSGGVELWRRARQALQARKADGFLRDLQVE